MSSPTSSSTQPRTRASPRSSAPKYSGWPAERTAATPPTPSRADGKNNHHNSNQFTCQESPCAIKKVLNVIISPLTRLVQPYKKAHEEYEQYQQRLPYRTVVPEPPNTWRDYVKHLVWRLLRQVSLCSFFLCTFPFLCALHVALKVVESVQRSRWLRYQRDWPHQSKPHVRKVRYQAAKEFPLDGWHLRCEDGRQRWYYGAPLRDGEEGNELGLAQACGLGSIEELRQVREKLNNNNNNNTTNNNNLPLREEVVEEQCRRRRFLERYQVGLADCAAFKEEKPQPKPRATSEEAMDDGVEFLLKLQDPMSGHWPNDYSGCMFLMAGLVFTKFIVGGGDFNRMFPPCKSHHHHTHPRDGKKTNHNNKNNNKNKSDTSEAEMKERLFGCEAPPGLDASSPLSSSDREEPCTCGEATRLELMRYLRNYQNEDGGWGQHTEGHSTMLGTALNYVSLRLLGMPAEDEQAVAAQAWLRAHGGAVTTPMWGRVWLSILGLYDWEGVNPIPPEMILLPDWVPFSLGKAWCHSRVIAIPFSYFYGLRWSAPTHPTLEKIKSEIYTQPFSSIPWRSFRGVACEVDVYTPTTPLFNAAMRLFDLYERRPVALLRRYALELNWRHMAYDDENTNFICLGPVNKFLNMLVTWIREGEHSTRYQLHVDRVEDYLYMGRTGMCLNGYNGSQLWDTSFAVQAICACHREMQYPTEMAAAHHYVDVAQVQEDPIAASYFYRHRTKGAWNFSTSPQGWQVSDCTAEGLRAILLLSHFKFPTQRIFDGVDEILSLRNDGPGGDGGWATYEPTRGPLYCELLNCAELFKDVMVDYSYAECSSSCIHTLALFRKFYPDYRRADVKRAISEGIACVLAKQDSEGGFYGSWAVCYTYAAWLVADALRISEELPEMELQPHCVKLVDFLLQHQSEVDGGWGEDVNACVRQCWVENPDGSQVVNTAWAVMALMGAAGSARQTSVQRRSRIARSVARGVDFIMSRQLEDGDWAQERISGIFNGNNPIHYPGYKNTMTVWALGKYNSWKKEYKE